MTATTGFRFRPHMHVRKAWEFRRAYRTGGRAKGRHLSVVVCRNRQRHSRLGLSVSKKLGNAVRRNKIRRMVREAYRLSRWEIESRSGHLDIVVIPNQEVERFPLEALVQELPLLVDRAAEKLTRRRGRKDRRRRRGRGARE